MQYINTIDRVDEGCIFCTKPARDTDKDDLILYRSTHCFVIMNLYPYNNGHLMVVPYRHLADISELSTEEHIDLWQTVCRAKDVLQAKFRPEGFNIGMNLGRIAGAGIDQHLHVHIVPRWNGDTNFMPVLGDVKIISQSLSDAWDCLHEGFNH